MLTFVTAVSKNTQCDDLQQVYLAISPAQLDLVHPPQFMDVFCQLVPDIFQVRGKNNLQSEKANRWYSSVN